MNNYNLTHNISIVKYTLFKAVYYDSYMYCGTIDLLWLDGDWERSAKQWKMEEFREYLHSFNPNVVLNSHMQGYGDYETPEIGIPVIKLQY